MVSSGNEQVLVTIRHLNIKIYGLVQGVFFRVTAKEKADILDLTGFVRNEKGGSLFIEAEGEKQNLDKFLQWCKEGSPMAKVERIEVTVGKLKNFSQFEKR